MSKLFKKHILMAILSALAGLGICFIFIIFDIKQMGIEFSVVNMLETFKAQYIYPFSAIFFPFVFSTTSLLISKQIKHNKLLAQQKRFSQNLLSSINQSIFICNQKLKVSYGNQRYRSDFGSDSVDSFIQDPEILESLRKGEEFQYREIEVTINNKVKWYLLTCSKFHELHSINLHEQEPRLILNLQNIDDVKASEKLIQEKDALIQSHAHLSALGEMAAGFAHEINNPLAIIAANNYILNKLINSNKYNEEKFIKIVKDNSTTINRITKIIKSLRALARRTEGEDLIAMPLMESLDEALTLCQIKINNTYVRFKTEFNEIENEIVDLRKIQFAQIVVNLLNNAIDAVKDSKDPETKKYDGWVKVGLERDKDNVYILITDSGKGIPMDVQQKIFEPLFTTKEVGQGTGLGLSLSLKMVQEHEGEIYINNECENTQFVIRIPKSRCFQAA